MTLKDEMKTLADKAKKTKQAALNEACRKEEEINREEGRKRGAEIVKELPSRIKQAAEKGKTNVYESYDNGDKYGGYMFGFISSWAEDQGFKTALQHNIEPTNEGGNRWSSLTISWE